MEEDRFSIREVGRMLALGQGIIEYHADAGAIPQAHRWLHNRYYLKEEIEVIRTYFASRRKGQHRKRVPVDSMTPPAKKEVTPTTVGRKEVG